MTGRHGADTPTPEEAFSRLWATRNFGLLLVVGGAYVLWRSVVGWDATRHPFSSYAWISFSVTLTALGLGVLWSYVFASRLHQKEPMEFWRREERTWRPRVLGSLAVIGGISAVLLALAFASGYPSLAGSLTGPAFWGTFIGVASITGGIRPLFPR